MEVRIALEVKLDDGKKAEELLRELARVFSEAVEESDYTYTRKVEGDKIVLRRKYKGRTVHTLKIPLSIAEEVLDELPSRATTTQLIRKLAEKGLSQNSLWVLGSKILQAFGDLFPEHCYVERIGKRLFLVKKDTGFRKR